MAKKKESEEEKDWRLHGRDRKGKKHKDNYGRNLDGKALERRILAKTLTSESVRDQVLYHPNKKVREKLYEELLDTVKDSYRAQTKERNVRYLARRLEGATEGKMLAGFAGRLGSTILYHIPHSVYNAARATQSAVTGDKREAHRKGGKAVKGLVYNLGRLFTGGDSYWKEDEITRSAERTESVWNKKLNSGLIERLEEKHGAKVHSLDEAREKRDRGLARREAQTKARDRKAA